MDARASGAQWQSQREACLAGGYIATRLADGKKRAVQADEVR
jgi:hypothetical protein